MTQKKLRCVQLAGGKGPAKAFTPMQVWDLRLAKGGRTELALPDGWTTALVVLRGAAHFGESEPIRAAEVGLFDRSGEGIVIDCDEDTTALLLCGEPIEEPVVWQGPFVMNTAGEIRQAMIDYQSGRMGHLS